MNIPFDSLILLLKSIEFVIKLTYKGIRYLIPSMEMSQKLKIPERFTNLLSKEQKLQGSVLEIISNFEPILKDNKLYFFEEYTDHGIDHIESVLNSAAEIISEETYEFLSAKDVAILILSIILHDLGMHIEYATFLAFLNGEYEKVIVDELDKKTWKQLWDEYLHEAKRFSDKQKQKLFGNENQPFREPDLTNKDNLTGVDRKLIGEFLRRFHTRFAHEVALKGLVGRNGQLIEFGGDRLDDLYKQLAGITARSHGMEIRDTFSYLKSLAGKAWKYPEEIHISFLMVVLRIADYFQFDKGRINLTLLKLKTFNSPVSDIMNQMHSAIKMKQQDSEDPETLYVHATPDNSDLFVRLNNLFRDIQRELDGSWAVLGEIYGKAPNEKQPKIKYRRITTNFDEKDFIDKLDYIPDTISFQADVELPKLLIAPLYGNDPSFGVRELIQNAVDACLERHFEEGKNGSNYTPEISVEVNSTNEGDEFVISDNGKGMSVFEIKNYFLRVGSSFRKSGSWRHNYADDNGKSLINRSGKFGIGILASFLLSKTIEIQTKHFKEDFGYVFTAGIDDEQIEIKLDKTAAATSGTRIRMLLSSEIAQFFDRENHDKNIPKWSDWYVLNFPEITYKYRGITRYPETIDPKTEDWHSIFPDDFHCVQWKYLKTNKIFYNGIVIPKTAISLQKEANEVLIEPPTVLITDNDGALPISLDRNAIDGEVSFISDLIGDIAKDFIASILCLELSPERRIEERTNSPYNPAKVAFLHDGYTFQLDYFFDRLAQKKFEFIHCFYKKQVPFNPLFLTNNTVLLPFSNSTLSLTNHEEILKLQKGGRVLLSKVNYDLLFDTTRGRIPAALKKAHKLEKHNKHFAIFKFNYNKPLSHFMKKFVFHSFNNIEIVQRDIQFMQQKDFFVSGSYKVNGETLPKAGKILSQLLKMYLNEDVIIPYDFEQRKTLYAPAFRDLEQFIKKYRKNVPSI